MAENKLTGFYHLDDKSQTCVLRTASAVTVGP